MPNLIDPNAPAFPSQFFEADSGALNFKEGLTIRAELAARFMAALLVSPRLKVNQTLDELAVVALQYSDALIAALNAEPKP